MENWTKEEEKQKGKLGDIVEKRKKRKRGKEKSE
jgi:hypothetical protein